MTSMCYDCRRRTSTVPLCIPNFASNKISPSTSSAALLEFSLLQISLQIPPVKTMGSSTPPLSIAIIGAGIAGITLAIALSEHNPSLCLTIYESRPEFSEISAGVGFGPNALKAMRLISPKLIAAYDQVKTPNQWPEKDHLWYDFRWSDTGKLILQVESEKGFAHCNASRVHLLAKLVELIPSTVKVEFGKRAIDVQDFEGEIGEGTGKSRIKFQDGTDVLVDAVVGCDGIRSACRRILLGENDPSTHAVYSGRYAYRKVVEMKKAIEAVGPEVENRQMYLGKGAHVLTFAIRGGKMLNVVAFKNGDGAPWTRKQWVIPSSREELLKDFAGCGDKATKILEVPILLFNFTSLPLLHGLTIILLADRRTRKMGIV